MPEDFFAVAPTDVATEHNTIRASLAPVAVWELSDAHFAFDSSVLLPSMTLELAELIAIVKTLPGTLLSVFGHADTTGNDEYNKVLSGRRGMALYALLTRDVDLWDHLYTTPHGGDDWRRDRDFSLGLMRGMLGPDATALSRRQLFDRYMGLLARDPDGKSFGLPKRAFLGKGADAKGKGDYQGCGEFNPLRIFSSQELETFRHPDQKANRDAAGAINRRVSVFFFPGDTKITVSKWPCPRATEATAGCRKRFWSDQAERRRPTDRPREEPGDADTFACRFYDRIAIDAARHGKTSSFGRLVVRAQSVLPSASKRELVVLDPAGKVLGSAVLNPESKPGQAPAAPQPAEIVLKPPFGPGEHRIERRVAGEAEPAPVRVDFQSLIGALLRERDRFDPPKVVGPSTDQSAH
jgi:hypothetical protein